MYVVIHPGIVNIFDSSRNLSEYLCGGLRRARNSTFAFVSSVFDTGMLLELYFQYFCVVFLCVKSLR